MNSKKIKIEIDNIKYQLPCIESLLDTVDQAIIYAVEAEIFFSSLNLRYTYPQILLRKKTTEQCKFNLVGGQATEAYQVQIGFLGIQIVGAFLPFWTY